jgi:hypothetical protein
MRPHARSRLDPIKQETARVDYFEKRYGMTRGMLEALFRLGVIDKYKFGPGKSCTVVFSIHGVEEYMEKSKRENRKRRKRNVNI